MPVGSANLLQPADIANKNAKYFHKIYVLENFLDSVKIYSAVLQAIKNNFWKLSP